jgi:hypothetical protein
MGIRFLIEIIPPENRRMIGREYGVFVPGKNSVTLFKGFVCPVNQFVVLRKELGYPFFKFFLFHTCIKLFGFGKNKKYKLSGKPV